MEKLESGRKLRRLLLLLLSLFCRLALARLLAQLERLMLRAAGRTQRPLARLRRARDRLALLGQSSLARLLRAHLSLVAVLQRRRPPLRLLRLAHAGQREQTARGQRWRRKSRRKLAPAQLAAGDGREGTRVERGARVGHHRLEFEVWRLGQ